MEFAISNSDRLNPAPDMMGAAELAPSGVLRMGLVEAPHAGLFFVEKEPLRGVTVDLGAALKELSLPIDYRVFPNSGECTEATSSGEIDAAFMPVDEERRAKVAFGPAYYLLRSTYLVSGASGLMSLAAVDEEHVRVVGIANTTTIRASARSLQKTVPVAARSVEEAVKMVSSGRADAFALSHDSLKPLLAILPGSRILNGAFQETSISIAVPGNRPAALACVTAFLEAAKRSGLVRKAFDRIGRADEAVAPLGR